MWSKKLQKLTKEYLEEMPAASMKHFGDFGYGFCLLMDGKYIIGIYDSDKKYEYETIEALIKDDWAVD